MQQILQIQVAKQKQIYTMEHMRFCRCKQVMAVTTSWTNANPGRRFKSCSKCGFFEWVDPPMCERARAIIPGLLRKLNRYEEMETENAARIYEAEMKNKSANQREKWLWVLVVVLIAVILYK